MRIVPLKGRLIQEQITDLHVAENRMQHEEEQHNNTDHADNGIPYYVQVIDALIR